jgi:type VI secretion system protein VasD
MKFDVDHAKQLEKRRFIRGMVVPLVFWGGLAALAGCTSAGSSSSPALPTAAPAARALEITISAAPNLNPGPAGNPAPLSMQIYVLKSTGRFQSLDYFALKNSGAGALGADIVDSSSVSVRPGETKTITVSSGIDGSYIGVAAGYREIDNAKWQAQTSIGSAEKFAVRAGQSSVSISQR